eukprot:GHVL01024618.1.p1 GENE.GHVL01024618.1~~GHVL01024618.1.p1  ORF type:complete len:138 (+),score=15.24 GHVL01024618.1:618-1031(+)
MSSPTSTPLKKPVFIKVKEIGPTSRGCNLVVKVKSVEDSIEKQRFDGTKYTVREAVVGDETGIIRLSVRDLYADVCTTGATIVIRNGHSSMFKSRLRLEVDKWGKITKSDNEVDFNINDEHDVSSIEWESVTKSTNR